MKVSGSRIKEALAIWEARKAAYLAQFETALFKFSKEEKDPPALFAEQVLRADDAIAALQEAQARFNLSQTVTVQGEAMSLCRAIKLVGGATRQHALWKAAVEVLTKGPTLSRYELRQKTVRNKDEELAEPTMSVKDALAAQLLSAKRERALRGAVERANAQETEIENMNPALFE